MARTSPPRRVVIAGGGVGAIEALLALRALGPDALTITVAAADERFVLPALTVAEPFAPDHAAIGPLVDIVRAEGARLHPAEIVAVEADERRVLCADGTRLAYDYLILAPGARSSAPYERAITFGLDGPAAFRAVLADIEHGYAADVAFVAPDTLTWPLPLYELALLTASRAREAGRVVALSLVSPEPSALAVFGTDASRAVAALFATAEIDLRLGAAPAVGEGGVFLPDGTALRPDHVVALPVLSGPRLAGVPADAGGFIPVDGRGRVPGLQSAYAVGDATVGPIKQGGIACQQADVAAGHIASLVGAAPEPPVEPLVLRGRLMTGQADRFFIRDVGQERSGQDIEPLWWPPTKVAGRHLGPWLASRQPRPRDDRAPDVAEGVDVEVGSPASWLLPTELLEADRRTDAE